MTVTDVWARFTELDRDVQARLAAVLETRGAEPGQRAMRRAFLGDVEFPPGARVLDVGCGTGVLTRMLARWPGVASVLGVDIAPALLDRARALAGDLPNVSFAPADAYDLPFGGAEFDVVAYDSTLSHLTDPGAALAEAHRVLRPGGALAVFDGDYATTTVALGPHDPLQVCVDAMMAETVHGRWLARWLPALAAGAGFAVGRPRGHGYVETADAAYLVTVVERGADLLRDLGRIGDATAEALKAEVRRRLAGGTFFGQIGYVSLTARRD
jgi:SAM-dependent methyltransferase